MGDKKRFAPNRKLDILYLMKTAATNWADGTAMAVRGVLAGCYRGRSEERAAVTHAVLVDAEGYELGEKTVCGRVAVEKLADSYALENDLAAPTCPGCAKKAAK